MTAEIHTPFGAVRPVAETPKDVIELLETTLERAKRGEISGLALAYVEGNLSCTTDWASGLAAGNLLVSVVTNLFWRVLEAHNQK